MRLRLIITAALLQLPFHAAVAASTNSPADSARLVRQTHFDSKIPAGNYSGITRIGPGLYALVSDKSPKDGFSVFQIGIDSISGEILSAANLGFFGDSLGCRDAEGIAFLPRSNTLLVVGEEDSRIIEYSLQGRLTGRSVQLEKANGNIGYESLAYNDSTATIWTCTEGAMKRDRGAAESGGGDIIRLQSFDLNLAPMAHYLYRLDAPKSTKSHRLYAHGVSELLACDNGSLLVLEREVCVPKGYIGSSVECRLYRVFPSAELSVSPTDSISHSMKSLPKTLVANWTTKLNLTNRSFANYEGMCIAQRLAGGGQAVILVADSQNRAKGVLHDWFRNLILH